MKKQLISLATASTLIGMTACSNDSDVEKVAEDVSQSTQQAFNKTLDTMEDGWNSVKDFSYDQKDKFSDALSDMGRSIENGYRNVASKSSGIGSKAKTRMENALEAFENSMDDLADASEDTWDDAKDKVEDAWDELQDAYRDATS